MFVFEVVIGLLIALGVVVSVFWLTFRDPPARRPVGSATAIAPNSDLDYLIMSSKDDGHGGFGA